MNALRLLLVTDTVGGVWTYSLDLACALKPLGVEPVLAVTGPSPSQRQREAAAGVRMIETGLPLEWLDAGPEDVLHAGQELAGLAERERADIVQTSSAALLAGAELDCACVAVQHSCVATWWQTVRGTPLPEEFEWRRQLVLRGLNCADAIVAPTRAFAAATERMYPLDKRVLALHNGRRRRGARALPQGDFVFTAGRLWDEAKNTTTLDRAAARLDAPFQAAGATAGPNGAAVRLDHLHLLGPLGEARLSGLLAARPIFASAALYEPFGLSVLEAAQSGCALVLSDIATHRELWDGAAIFVDAQEDRGFAAAIADLLGDRAARNRLGDRARDRARQYRPERMAEGMMRIYDTVKQPQLVAGAA